MSDRENEIKRLKIIFEKAKNSSRRASQKLSDLDLHGDFVGALIIPGKEKLHELKDEIYPYINDLNPEYRAEAVRTLGWGTRLHLPEFRDKAYEIWLNDTDEEVLVAALVAWTSYHYQSCNPRILVELYEALIEPKYSIEIKVHALDALFSVSGAYVNTNQGYRTMLLADSETIEELNSSIDWERVYNIMEKYVPNWKK